MAVLTAVAPERDTFLTPATTTGVITIRKSVYALSAQEVSDYRLAVSRIAKISAAVASDQRGYQWIAGLHGLPQQYCHRNQIAFALWHRPFVQQYEQRLQDVLPHAFIPYWDWSTHRAEAEGIPQIFLDATWHNPDTNKDEPNPLLTQPQTLINRGNTTRAPGKPGDLTQFRNMAQQALLAPDYTSFTADLENPHNGVHGWIGGDMGVIAYAAYDPLFWSHHAFVEYLFCQWQDAHPSAVVPALQQQELAPFSVTVDRIWNYRSLGYAYAPDNASDLQVSGIGPGPGAAAANVLNSRATVAHFPIFATDPEDIDRAEIVFQDLRPPMDSFAVRMFADQPDADATTPTIGNPNYLTTRFFFGHGVCGGAEGHCDYVVRDFYDLRPTHHFAPRTVRVDVTKALVHFLRTAKPPAEGTDASITLVAVDAAGNLLEDAGLYFEGLSLIVR